MAKSNVAPARDFELLKMPDGRVIRRRPVDARELVRWAGAERVSEDTPLSPVTRPAPESSSGSDTGDDGEGEGGSEGGDQGSGDKGNTSGATGNGSGQGSSPRLLMTKTAAKSMSMNQLRKAGTDAGLDEAECAAWVNKSDAFAALEQIGFKEG